MTLQGREMNTNITNEKRRPTGRSDAALLDASANQPNEPSVSAPDGESRDFARDTVTRVPREHGSESPILADPRSVEPLTDDLWEGFPPDRRPATLAEALTEAFGPTGDDLDQAMDDWRSGR